MKRKTTYTKITAKIIATTLVFTILISYIYGTYIKQDAISNLAHIDARKTSKLVFETLYSAMQRGWTKSDLEEIINRLNTIDEKMVVNVYRSQIVADLFGDIDNSKLQRETHRDVIKAMQAKEILNVNDEGFIEYFYPVIAKDACLKCHLNAKVGNVLGVIDISYPIEDLKVSLTEMINFFIFFIIAFSIVIFIAIFVELDQYLIKPIKNFSNVIKNITNSQDMTKRVEIDDNIEEIDSIKSVFNVMLDSIETQFYYDNLTGLGNRRKLSEILEKKYNLFFIIINIDSFQEINDLYGEDAGDIILKEFANFLQESVPDKDTVFRLHSDEFAHLCKRDVDLDEQLVFIEELGEKISQRVFAIGENTEINLSVTMGVSYGYDSLLSNADIALKIAKKSKKNYLIYNDSMAMAKEYEKNLDWSMRLKKAIENDKIIPVFQPIVETDTKKLVKYEVLMRMEDENGSLIAPVHFLELAKRNKLYHKLTKIIVSKAFEAFKENDYAFSINLSVEDILNKDVYTLIIERLQNCDYGSRVVFEIIESEGIENFAQVLEFINEVKKYGARISIDDFGTGYSNFDYLMKLKVDYIKIDGSMIKNIDVDVNSQMITQTIIDFAKKMNIKTVAEYVYSQDVFEKIYELGVDYAQGYYFGKPTTKIK